MSLKHKWKSATKKSSALKRPPETVVAVFPDTKKGERAFQALQDALKEHQQSTIERLPFEKLDFGDLDMLEKFYSAPVVVVDVTERQYEACLYYQLGIRESFGMKHNIVTCVDQQNSYTGGRKASIIPTDQSSSTSSYGVSTDHGRLVCEQQMIEFLETTPLQACILSLSFHVFTLLIVN